jgi:hypothetical protein
MHIHTCLLRATHRTVPFGARVSVHYSLIPCVKAYRASLANSILDERVGSTTPLIAGRPEENALRNYFLVTGSSMRNGSWHGCNALTPPCWREHLFPLLGTADQPTARPFLSAKYQGVTSKTAFGCLASDLPWHFPEFCPASLRDRICQRPTNS